MFRTPSKRAIVMSSDSSPEEPARASVAQARKSIESKLDSSDSRPSAPVRQKPKCTTYKSRMTEASALLAKIKSSINTSRNIKTEIKNDIIEAANKMWKLIKDAEEGRKHQLTQENKGTQTEEEERKEIETDMTGKNEEKEKELMEKLEEHTRMLKETKEVIENATEEIRKSRHEASQIQTYASVAAGSPKTKMVELAPALHSIVVTSKDETETGEEIVENIRKAVKAKEDGLRIDRIRKAKDRKVIIGVKEQEELEKIKEKIRKNGKNLKCEDILNKDPLIIIKDVMSCHSNEELISAIKTQNTHLLGKVEDKNYRMEVKYRRKARNPLLAHIVCRVSPQIWQNLTSAGAVFVDVQRVRVEDQSPLVQCSKCLGHGHGRRFCTVPLDVCSHCGGHHKRADCADWLAAGTPVCCNCQRAGLLEVGHNAFSKECPIKIKWETLARSSIAYI